LNVLQINTLDRAGGAETVARSLHLRLLATGHKSAIAVGEKRTDSDSVIQIPNDQLRSPLNRSARAVSTKYLKKPRLLSRAMTLGSEPSRFINLLRGRDDFNFPGTVTLLDHANFKPDVVHAHNLHGGYFDLRFLPKISQASPTVITMHDMWLITGHCAQSFDCQRWAHGCGECPYLGTPPAVRRDSTHFNWEQKRKIFESSELFVACPSKWLLSKLENSILAPAIKQSTVIHNGIDQQIFHIGDKAKARHELNLPAESFIVLSVGNVMEQNPFRNPKLVSESVSLLAQSRPGWNITFVQLGANSDKRTEGPFTTYARAYEKSAERLAMYYQAADVYVHTTNADTFPTTVLESMACGTPVLGTNIGGIPEQIEDGYNGILISHKDPKSIAVQLEDLLDNPAKRVQLSANAQTRINDEFNVNLMATRYIDWYSTAMDNHNIAVSAKL
jgi:glycosyltransferase involved in cell wall biosynthesis